MVQFLADNVDQLDLAIDQLAVNDRNFDRFALMLIDNVIELTLHRYAQDKFNRNKIFKFYKDIEEDQKKISEALGQNFDRKVKYATSSKLLDSSTSESILCLHSFRNNAYHKGLRHEGILHSLAVFYLINACLLLKSYEPEFWSHGSNDKISYRAMKYLGNVSFLGSYKKSFDEAYDKLHEVAKSIAGNIIEVLYKDMKETIELIDGYIQYLSDNSPKMPSRDRVIIDSQIDSFAFTDEGKKFAIMNGCNEEFVGGYLEWFVDNYNWPVKKDPIPNWQKRLLSLKSEKDEHKALKKYCDFMKQTEDLREQISDSVGQLDVYINQEIDRLRGK